MATVALIPLAICLAAGTGFLAIEHFEVGGQYGLVAAVVAASGAWSATIAFVQVMIRRRDEGRKDERDRQRAAELAAKVEVTAEASATRQKEIQQGLEQNTEVTVKAANAATATHEVVTDTLGSRITTLENEKHNLEAQNEVAIELLIGCGMLKLSDYEAALKARGVALPPKIAAMVGQRGD